MIHVLSQSLVSPHSSAGSPERSPHHNQHLYSTWSKAYSFTYGLGLTEQFKDHLDVLTAVKSLPKPFEEGVPPEIPSLRMASSTLEKSEYPSESIEFEKLAVGEKELQEEKDRQKQEAERILEERIAEEDHLAREFEYVPLQLMYQHLHSQAGSHKGGQHIGVWPFTKEMK